jgi:hypothetical protein
VSIREFLRRWFRRHPEDTDKYRVDYRVQAHCVYCAHRAEVLASETVFDLIQCPECGRLTFCSD